MINRAKMPRQLRSKGGITSVVPRTNYLFGGIKRRIRKLIPNELASVAVKAAPFVAPFSPKTAALMRGIGRFDQRGSISDALKQGAATFAFGAGARKLGGAENVFGDFGFSSPLSPERTQGFTSLFDRQAADPKITPKDKSGGILSESILEKTTGKIPGVRALPKLVQEQLLAGTLTSGVSLLASYFQGEFEEPEPGESMEEYLARRREYVGTQMRTYMDNYYANDPEYMKLDDAGREALVARYNIRDGGRVGYQTGGITMANTLAENIARNRAAQAAFEKSIAPAREKVKEQIRKRTPVQEYAMGEDSILGPLSKKAASTIIEGQDRSQAALDVLNKTMSPTGAGEAGGIITDGPNKFRINADGSRTMIGSVGEGIMTQAPTIADSASANLLPGFSRFIANDASQPPGSYNYIDNKGNIYTEKEYANLQDIDQTGMPRQITQEDIDTFNFNPAMITGFDYSQPVNWSPGQPAPEGYRVVKMMGDEFLERKFPSKEEVARLPMPLVGPMGLMGPGMMPPVNIPQDPDAGLSGKEYAEKYGLEYAKGGRVKFDEGADKKRQMIKDMLERGSDDDTIMAITGATKEEINQIKNSKAKGGMPTGIMRTNKAGVMERDYRDKGGFVPVGIKEKADDVPAMLSKNEFVFTADAVRGAGNGSIERGAQKMYDTMKRLEKRVV